MLTGGLLIGSAGGGIAAADDTTDSAPQSSVDGAGTAAPTASEPTVSTATPTPGSALRRTVTNTLTLIGKLSQQQAEATKRLLTQSQTVSKTDAKASDVTEETVTPLAAETEVAPVTTDVAPVTDPATNSATDPMAPVSAVVNPVTTAVVTVVGAMGSVPGVIAGLPTSEAPVVDVITTMQEMLTSVTGAVLPLANVPSDLYTLLAAGAQAAPATIGGGASFGVGPMAVSDAPLLAPVTPAWTPVVPSSDIWSAHGDVSALATGRVITAAGFSKELSISGTAPLAMQGAAPTGVLPVLEHAVAALLVPISLSTLAALALPGVGGLLIVCAAGMRIGYRQAKAGLMLRASGIARFAGNGPLGVVRTGSLIALRPRPVRAARHAAPRAAGLLDQAA